ncbi:MAG: o-succinylbenzoate synthase [Flammeovirgaceae bacterium]|jgi:o-succinylbenzoate synthase
MYKLPKFQIQIIPHQLQFKFKAGTSRGVLTEKTVYYLKLWDVENPNVVGVGECAPLVKLSIDDIPDFEEKLEEICIEVTDLESIEDIYGLSGIESFPSIITGLEMAFLDLENGGKKLIYDSDFHAGKTRVPINGLIWMGDKEFMFQQIREKLEAGFDCIKMKIGAIDFEQECELLNFMRKQFSAKELTLRVDANGAFAPKEALEKLKRLSEYELHSIEQPIKAGQFAEMAKLCEQTPLPIALDEELIGVHKTEAKSNLLNQIQPQYIILKPTLMGGFRSSEEWIQLAESQNIAWWMTSALESNIGLNAIAQFTAKHQVKVPQGLGTGQLFHNNISSPLEIENGEIFYDSKVDWKEVGGRGKNKEK